MNETSRLKERGQMILAMAAILARTPIDLALKSSCLVSNTQEMGGLFANLEGNFSFKTRRAYRKLHGRFRRRFDFDFLCYRLKLDKNSRLAELTSPKNVFISSYFFKDL